MWVALRALGNIMHLRTITRVAKGSCAGSFVIWSKAGSRPRFTFSSGALFDGYTTRARAARGGAGHQRSNIRAGVIISDCCRAKQDRQAATDAGWCRRCNLALPKSTT